MRDATPPKSDARHTVSQKRHETRRLPKAMRDAPLPKSDARRTASQKRRETRRLPKATRDAPPPKSDARRAASQSRPRSEAASPPNKSSRMRDGPELTVSLAWVDHVCGTGSSAPRFVDLPRSQCVRIFFFFFCGLLLRLDTSR